LNPTDKANNPPQNLDPSAGAAVAVPFVDDVESLANEPQSVATSERSRQTADQPEDPTQPTDPAVIASAASTDGFAGTARAVSSLAARPSIQKFARAGNDPLDLGGPSKLAASVRYTTSGDQPAPHHRTEAIRQSPGTLNWII